MCFDLGGWKKKGGIKKVFFLKKGGSKKFRPSKRGVKNTPNTYFFRATRVNNQHIFKCILLHTKEHFQHFQTMSLRTMNYEFMTKT